MTRKSFELNDGFFVLTKLSRHGASNGVHLLMYSEAGRFHLGPADALKLAESILEMHQTFKKDLKEDN